MFIAALFTIAKGGSNPSVHLDKQNVVYTYNGNYSALKRKEILTHATTWINLEDIMLSEESQTKKFKYYMLPLIGGV